MHYGMAEWIRKKLKSVPKLTLDDVIPMKPDDYPARRLRDKLDSRREALRELAYRTRPMGLPEGPDGF